MSGGLMQPDGGGLLYHHRRGGGAGGGAAGTNPWQDVINITSSTYGAVGDAVYDAPTETWSGTDNMTAILAAVAESEASGLPVYAPDGQYMAEFSRGYTEDGGRILIDWPGFKLLGDGAHRSGLHGKSTSDLKGRRASYFSDTTQRGRRSGALIESGAAVQLTSIPDAANFTPGDLIYFAQNSDGTGRRDVSGLGSVQKVLSRNLTLGTVNISSMSEVLLFVANDYLFIHGKVLLQTAGDYLNWSEGMGLIASPNADGSSPRAIDPSVSSIKVQSTDVARNAINISNYPLLTGFADGDYLFCECNFALFHLAQGADADDVAYDVTIKDIALSGEIHDRTADARTDIVTFGLFQSLGAGVTKAYKIHLDQVDTDNFTVHVAHSEGTAGSYPSCTLRISGGEHTGGNQIVELYSVSDWDGKTFQADEYAYFHDTNSSHLLYIHPNVTLLIDACDFDNSGTDESETKEAIDHWGQYDASKLNSITRCWFGPGITAHGILTGTNGHYYIAGNTFTNILGIGVRSSCTIVGNTFRPEVDGAESVRSYFNGSRNSHIKVIGNHFDIALVPVPGTPEGYTGILIELPGVWTIQGNTFTCDTFGHEATGGTGTQNGYNDYGPEPSAVAMNCITISANAIAVGDVSGVTVTATVDVVDNICTFAVTAGQQYLLSMFSLPKVRAEGNRVTCRTASTEGAIRTVGSVAGAGPVMIRGNSITTTTGDGIRFVGTFAGAPSFRLLDNTIVSNSTARACVTLGYSAGTCEVSDNRLTSHAAGNALLLTSACPAGSLTGRDNEYGASPISIYPGNRQLLRGRRSTQQAVVASAAALALSPDSDRYEVSGNTTIDQIYWPGRGMLGHHGTDAELYLTGTPTLSNAGNFVGTGGARTAGTFVNLRYNADIDTATTPLARIASFVTASGVITLVTGGDTANFRVGMALKFDDDIAAGSPRAQTAVTHVVSIGAGTVTVNTVSSAIPVTGLANNDYIFLGAGRWLEA